MKFHRHTERSLKYD